MLMRTGALLSIVLPLAIGLFGGHCSGSEQPRRVPLPQLSSGPVDLRVAHAVNSRFPRFAPEQVRVLLSSLQTAVRTHFGVDLRFSAVDEIAIAPLFARIPPEKAKSLSKSSYDFKRGQGNPGRLARAYAVQFEKSGRPVTALLDEMRPVLGEISERSYQGIGKALAQYQLTQVTRWQQIVAADGRPAIDASPYNEFMMWVALGYGEVPYELILTNQPIVSLETDLPDPHILARGGYSNGITTYGQRARHGTVSIWSTFAFTAEDPQVVRLREGETYASRLAAELAGIGAAHELGHQLFHFVHPYGNGHCVMNPVPRLAFQRWAQQLDPAQCPIGSSPAMTPGAYTFLF